MKYVLSILLSIGLLGLLSAQLDATGLGVYGTVTKGSATWTYHEDEAPDSDADSDTSKLGFGFVLDTTVANDSLFNYRLNIGYGKAAIDNEGNLDIEGKNYHLFNTFGFGVLRSELIRWWLGPQIGLGLVRGEYDSLSSDVDNRFTTFYFSIGLVTGINFNIGEVVTLGIDGGYRINRHVGTAESSETYGVTGTEKEMFVNLSFLLRINDMF
jgi:hypothetical protein